MPFSSLLFVHLFLPLFLAVYWLAPRTSKNAVAIAGSLVFYAWGAPKFLPVVVGLGFVDYVLSHRIAVHRGTPRGKLLLALGVTMHLGVLAYFKYANFFVAEISALVGPIEWTKVVLPIGISFITFEEISYLTDVYRGDARPARRLSHYLLFLTLFPHSIAGPIFRWKDLEAQFGDRTHSWALAREGFERFACGLAKKVLVADSVGVIVDGIFKLSPAELTPGLAWIGAIGYAVQIYFDFSGYSDMAIGLGKLLGFRFKENFDRPYISASVTEFWTRWHISLSSWLRDYLYIPLGGNRRGRRRALVNLMIVFTLSGLWHGPAWTFVLWGMVHGLAVTFERVLGARYHELPAFMRHVMTLGFVVIAWVFFRATSASHAFDFIAVMFGGGGAGVLPPDAVLLPWFGLFALAIGVAISLLPILTKYREVSLAHWRDHAVVHATWIVLFVLSSIHLTNMRITPLIYFRF